MSEEALDISTIKPLGVLGLRKNGVRQEKKADPSVQREPRPESHFGSCGNENSAYHPRMNSVQDSASRITDRTTQYFSHIERCSF